MNFREFNERCSEDEAYRAEWKDCLNALRESHIGNPVKLKSDGEIDSDYNSNAMSYTDIMNLRNNVDKENIEEWKDYKKTLKESGIRNNIEVDEDGNIKQDADVLLESSSDFVENFDEEKRMMEEIVADLKLKKSSENIEEDNFDNFLESADFSVNNQDTENFVEELNNRDKDFSLKETINSIGKYKKSDDPNVEDYTMFSNEAEEEEKHFSEKRTQQDTEDWNKIKNTFKNSSYVRGLRI